MSDNLVSPARARTASGWVAAVDLGLRRQREADHLAESIAAALVEAGAAGVEAATHANPRADGISVAVSVVCETAPADPYGVLTAVARTVADEHGTPAVLPDLLMGEHYQGSEGGRAGLESAAVEHRHGRGGRAVVFAGSAELTGALTVADLTARSAIDRVHVLAGGIADLSTLVNTRDFLRPRFDAGELVLDTQPAVGGTLVPFECRSPTPCCADHD